MKILDKTFPTPAENLACDEAFLDFCEEGFGHEILRFWAPSEYFVVLGYSNKMSEEILPENCRKKNIPVFRRCSGGGTVLQGPGCLNYSLILKINGNDSLKNIVSANRFIMERHRAALEKILKKEVNVQGSTDLTFENLKFSGNSQRRKRNYLLFHGTFLLDFDISLIEKTLAMPPREPAYRKKRKHSEFLVNLKTSPDKIKKSLKEIWKAEKTLTEIPTEKIRKLVETLYSMDEWNLKF